MVNLRDLIGGRFVNGGRSVSTGMDCWGLVMEVFRRYGMGVPDFTVDAFAFRNINKLAVRSMEATVWEEVRNPQQEDLPLVVLMRMHPEFITHAGVLIDINRIIHTTKGTGVITSRATALKSRIIGYYKYVKDN